MFVGHQAIGLAGRAKTPRISLGTWFLAINFLDLLFPIFLFLGWERAGIDPGITKLVPIDFEHYPISHSLVGALGWSVAFAVGYLFLARAETDPRARRWGSVLLGAGVFSHWVLDFLVHRPDLPTLPDGSKVGLGLWNVPAVELPLEAGLFVLGTVLYLRATRARDGIGRWALWGLLAFLLLSWLWVMFGPPPPSARALAWTALLGWLVPLWAWWVDRHRTDVAP